MAGALAVDVKRNRSFFPNIYNEDWFFVLDAGKRLQQVATVGQVIQDPYDPYRPERARAEELGDVLAKARSGCSTRAGLPRMVTWRIGGNS